MTNSFDSSFIARFHRMIFRAPGFVAGFILFMMAVSAVDAAPAEYDEAVKQYQNGRYEESLQTIRSVFDDNKGVLELRMLAARNYEKMGNLDSALSHMLYATKEHPDAAAPAIYMAKLQHAKGADGRALDILRRTAGRFANDPWARYELAAFFFEQKKYGEARQQVEAVMAKNPNFFQAVYLDGLIYLVEGSLETAEFRFNNAARIKMTGQSWNKRLFNNLGLVNEKLADRADTAGNPALAKEKRNLAKDYYKKAVALDGDYAIAKANFDRLN